MEMQLSLSSVTSLIDIGLSPHEHYIQFVPPGTFGVIFNSITRKLDLVRSDGEKTPLRSADEKIYVLRGFIGLRGREERAIKLSYSIEDEIIRIVLRTFKSLVQLRDAVIEFCPSRDSANVIANLWGPEVFVEPLTPLSDNATLPSDMQSYDVSNCDTTLIVNQDMFSEFTAPPLWYPHEMKEWDLENVCPSQPLTAPMIVMDPRNLPSPTEEISFKKLWDCSSYAYSQPLPSQFGVTNTFPAKGASHPSRNITDEYLKMGPPAESVPRLCNSMPWETGQQYLDMRTHGDETSSHENPSVTVPSTIKHEIHLQCMPLQRKRQRDVIPLPSIRPVTLIQCEDLDQEIQILAHLQVIRTRWISPSSKC